MKSFKEYITESWKKYRKKQAYANVLYKDGIRGVDIPILDTDDTSDNAAPESDLTVTYQDEDDTMEFDPNKKPKGIGFKRFDIGVQYDRGSNKRTYRLAKALERNPNNKDLIDKVDSASLRNLGRVQFRGAKLRGHNPGSGFEQFLSSREYDEYAKNAAAFYDNKSHRELVGTAIGDLASTRDWYRFHNINLKGKNTNQKINKFLKNLHASGRIVKSII